MEQALRPPGNAESGVPADKIGDIDQINDLNRLNQLINWVADSYTTLQRFEVSIQEALKA